jgi:hypothetical protein
MTISIARRNASGDLENATTVTLSDSGATYGIRRDSDSVVMLAAGAATTNPSTGLYSYDESALNLDPSESYTASWKFVMTGLPTAYVTTRINALASASTRRGLRRSLAKELKRYQKLTTTSAAASSESTATRTLISTALINDDAGVDQFKGVWLYISSGALAGQQSRMRQTGYTPATGQLVARRPFTAVPASSVDFEMHWRLPVLTEDGITGLHEHLNHALDVLHVPNRYEIDGEDGAENYASPTWLRAQQQVGRLIDGQTDENLNPLTTVTNGARLRTDAQLPRIELLGVLYGSSDTFQVELARPASTLIMSGGAWDTTYSGLSDDDDEMAADPILVVQTALAYCYQELSRISNAVAEASYWTVLAEKQEHHAMVLRLGRQPTIGDDPMSEWQSVVTPRSGRGISW